MGETVNHPSHYQGVNGVEAIDAIVASLGVEGAKKFCHGNALKYLMRAGKKGDYKEDLEKAKWYIDYIINSL